MSEPTRANREGDTQGLPTPNDEQDIQSRVIHDINERRKVGIMRYGTALQPFNGRDAAQDLYEELLDAVMYQKQAIVEREALPTAEQLADCVRLVFIKHRGTTIWTPHDVDTQDLFSDLIDEIAKLFTAAMR